MQKKIVLFKSIRKMKQKGMTFDHNICYFILLFSSLLKKEVSEKENEVAKIVIKSHTFLFHQLEIVKDITKEILRQNLIETR